MDVKPGWKTSEFWFTIVAMLASMFVLAGFLPEDHVAMKIAAFIVSALAQMGYSISRGLAKKDAVIKEPEWTKEKEE
jgi:hypothetical protein